MRRIISHTTRGQSSLEYMVMLAIALGVFTLFLIATSHLISSSRSQVSIESAQRAVAEIKEAADFVFVHGHPSKLQIKVYIPSNIRSAGFEVANNKTAYVSLYSPPSYTDVYAVTRGKITGNLSAMTHEGYFIINVESLSNQLTNITVVT